MNRVLNNLMQWPAWPLHRLFLIGLFVATACASQPVSPSRTIYEAGLNTVRLEKDPDSTSNAHPAMLTAAEVGTLLRRSLNSSMQILAGHRHYCVVDQGYA
jgi:hypothetical protein